MKVTIIGRVGDLEFGSEVEYIDAVAEKLIRLGLATTDELEAILELEDDEDCWEDEDVE